MTGKEIVALASIVRSAVAARVKSNRAFDKDAIVRDLLRRREPPQGPEADFDRACRQYAMVDLVSRAMRAFDKPDAAERAQLVLPGYEHLQSFYSVVREGAQLYVPLVDMTDAEIDAKAAEHDAQAEGHTKHAEELRAFKSSRTKERRRT